MLILLTILALAVVSNFIYLAYLAAKGEPTAIRLIWLWIPLILFMGLWFKERTDELLLEPFSLALCCFSFIAMTFLLREINVNRETRETKTSESELALNRLDGRIDIERQRIASMIHDEINPNVILSKIEISHIQDLIKQLGDSHEGLQIDQSLEKILALQDKLYGQLRTVITNTRFEVVDNVGLVGAIDVLISHYKAALEYPVFEFEHNLPSKLPINKLANRIIYMVVQEALLNAIKHAQASIVTIKANIHEQAIDFDIRDNGVGIKSRNKSGGYGLYDIERRLMKIGSKLVLQTSSSGTSIQFRVRL